MVFIYTTCPTAEAASGICHAIMDRRLALSVRLSQVGSLYLTGEGKEKKSEYEILIRTNENKVQDIEDEIVAQSPDTMPFIGVVDIRRFNRDYKDRAAHLLH